MPITEIATTVRALKNDICSETVPTRLLYCFLASRNAFNIFANQFRTLKTAISRLYMNRGSNPYYSHTNSFIILNLPTHLPLCMTTTYFVIFINTIYCHRKRLNIRPTTKICSCRKFRAAGRPGGRPAAIWIHQQLVYLKFMGVMMSPPIKSVAINSASSASTPIKMFAGSKRLKPWQQDSPSTSTTRNGKVTEDSYS